MKSRLVNKHGLTKTKSLFGFKKKKNFILFAALQTKIQFYFMRNVSERLPDGKMVGKEKLWHIAPPPSCFPKHPHMLFQVLMAHRIRFWLMLYSSSKFIAIPNIPPSRYLWWQLTFFLIFLWPAAVQWPMHHNSSLEPPPGLPPASSSSSLSSSSSPSSSPSPSLSSSSSSSFSSSLIQIEMSDWGIVSRQICCFSGKLIPGLEERNKEELKKSGKSRKLKLFLNLVE